MQDNIPFTLNQKAMNGFVLFRMNGLSKFDIRHSLVLGWYFYSHFIQKSPLKPEHSDYRQRP